MAMGDYYKGEKALTLESESIVLKLLPERGAKIASIYYKPLEIELLWQIEGDKYTAPPNPANGFTAEDSSGFDDMLPSILSEDYFWESGAVSRIEDHGNVWYAQWQTHQVNGGECFSSLEVDNFPLFFEKLIKVKDSSIHVGYALTNNSPEAFKGLWAAHPLFAMREGMRLQIERDTIEIINAMQESQLGQDNFGQRLSFEASSPEWKRIATFSADSGMCAKFYFSDTTLSSCSLIDEVNQLAIVVEYDPKRCPYLGIWKNEGGWAGQNNLGIEPATSAMDCPSLAHSFGMQNSFPPHETTVWDLKITVEPLRTQPSVEL